MILKDVTVLYKKLSIMQEEFRAERSNVKAWMCRKFIAMLEFTPTIEAEPVIHAHWIHETKENIWGNMQKIRKCSNCLQYGYKNKAFEFDFPYCPCCSAKMDGKEGEE